MKKEEERHAPDNDNVYLSSCNDMGEWLGALVAAAIPGKSFLRALSSQLQWQHNNMSKGDYQPFHSQLQSSSTGLSALIQSTAKRGGDKFYQEGDSITYTGVKENGSG